MGAIESPTPVVHQPSVTIAVVVRNAAEVIGRTLDSAIEQDYPNKSILVVDGMSTDGTLSKVAEYRPAVDQVISERDDGVYDGMNKAARAAEGDYIIYMNAGDRFHGPSSLREAMSSIEGNYPDIIIGNYVYLHQGAATLITPLETSARISLLERNNLSSALRDWACHQATIVKTTFLRSSGGYDTRYPLLADQEFLLRAHDRDASVHCTTAVICSYESGGMSSDITKSSAEFVRLLSARSYDKRLLKMHYYMGFTGRMRWALRRIAIGLFGFGRTYAQRNALAARLARLKQKLTARQR